jgi:hypothetical protein
VVKAWLQDVDQDDGVMAALKQLGHVTNTQARLLELAEIAFDDAANLDPTTTSAALFTKLPCGRLRFKYTRVASMPADAAPGLQPVRQLACTPSLVLNMARILAASTIQGPLLLEGPPGIGKTAVVEHVASLLGYPCERINLSGSVTVGQLLGSYVPQVVGGQRVFAWQDGVLMQALKRGAWVLLDEVNLAPPEVLSAIAPLLDRWDRVHHHHKDVSNAPGPPRILVSGNTCDSGAPNMWLPAVVCTQRVPWMKPIVPMCCCTSSVQHGAQLHKLPHTPCTSTLPFSILC